MACNAWLQAIIPCLARRKSKVECGQGKETKRTSSTRRLTTSKTGDLSPTKSTGETSKDGLKHLRSNDYSIANTFELPCPTPTKPTFAELPSQRSPPKQAPSKAEDSGRKASTGKRKRAQTLNISSPSNFRRNDGDIKLSFPLTYPSPSRTRPEKLLIDRRDPSLEDEQRPRTAPSNTAFLQKDPFPHRSTSLRNRSTDPQVVPPIPGFDMEHRIRRRSGSTSSLIKRKPVPIRTRTASNPASPDHERMASDTSLIPVGFAIEMPGSMPPVAASPVELEVPELPVTTTIPLSELDAAAEEASEHTSIENVSDTPPDLNSTRLSVGTLHLLSFFPSTPKPSRPASLRSVKRAGSASPPSLPLESLISTLPQGVDTLSPTAISPRSILAPFTLAESASPSTTTMAPAIPPALPAQTPPQQQQRPQPKRPSSSALSIRKVRPALADKALPPIPPQPVGFDRGRYISLAAGLELSAGGGGGGAGDGLMDLEKFTGMAFGDDGDRAAKGQSARSMSTESIQIFMAPVE